MAKRRVYKAAECAMMLDISVDTFYRRFNDYRAQGMPASATLGRYRPEISSFDAWLVRHHPAAPPQHAAANDDTAAADARERLQRAYAMAGRAG